MESPFKKFTSLAVEILGWSLLVAGIAALVLPGPGLLALFGGLTLLATRHKWAKRRLDPVRQAALKTAHNGVASLPKLIVSSLAALALICLGIFWGLGPNAPPWWPLDDKYWLIGGWGTGGTLIGSGIIAGTMLVYSYIK
ncbi:MAG TPA: PGPGW domain-containing protein, partial [Candidatus Saccharimonadales bacterium]|nr:PGPGW domain-containing protein [Candidatus Saccharimonadales bacterium]